MNISSRLRLSISTAVIWLSAVSVLAMMVFIYFISGIARERAIDDVFRIEARQTAALVREALRPAWENGWDAKTVSVSATRVESLLNGAALKVFSAHESGSHKDLMAGMEEVIRRDGDTLHYMTPVRVGGSMKGIIELSYAADSIMVPLDYFLSSIFYYTLFGMWLIFSILYFNIRFGLSQPIVRLAMSMRDMTKGGQFSTPLKTDHRIKELNCLVEDFNSLVDAINTSRADLEEMSVRDHLTGLYNRRKFEAELDAEFERAKRYAGPFALVWIDMDHFKRINDTYGHLNGDLVLQELARRLAGCLRKSDVFARLGGDEFAIILPETNYEHGLAVATKLHLAMNASPFSLPCGEVAVSASISLVEYPDDGKDVVELQSAMDQVLYRAKAAGKNCVMSLRSTTPIVA